MVMEKKKKEVLAIKYIVHDATVIKSLNNLDLFLKKNYGIKNYFKFFVLKRFESKKQLNHVDAELYSFIILKYFRRLLPQNKDIRYRYYAHLYLLYHIRLYKAYRQLMGLPSRGQRTWSNANGPKLRNFELRRIFSIKAWQAYPFLTKTYAVTAALAELSNKLWKTNWLKEWKSAKESIEQVRKNNVAKIDLFAMSKFFNRVELGDYKISKKTKQKKKIEKKGSFTTGLEPGFAKIYLVRSARELRHINFQFYYTKTTRLIVEKDNKKGKKRRGGIKLGKGVKSIKVARKMQKKKKKTVWD